MKLRELSEYQFVDAHQIDNTLNRGRYRRNHAKVRKVEVDEQTFYHLDDCIYTVIETDDRHLVGNGPRFYESLEIIPSTDVYRVATPGEQGTLRIVEGFDFVPNIPNKLIDVALVPLRKS